MIFNYQDISYELLDSLPKREKDIISRRFGFTSDEKETLQTIGKSYGVTRERVRQIEKSALIKLKEKVSLNEPVFRFFLNQLETSGKLRKEEIYLAVLNPDQSFDVYVYFLLCLAEPFTRFNENRKFYSLWTLENQRLKLAEKIDNQVVKELKKKKEPVNGQQILRLIEADPNLLFAVLEASKKVEKGPQGLWGLNQWAEINPRGIRDKAYIVFQEENRPLHFREVARLIDESGLFNEEKKAHPQTVHNELIKDDKFVLVGRGIYALSEWGYEPGMVKDVITRVLKEAKKPLTKEEIIDRVLDKRVVERNTVLLNLRNKKLFSKNQEGKYSLSAKTS